MRYSPSARTANTRVSRSSFFTIARTILVLSRKRLPLGSTTEYRWTDVTLHGFSTIASGEDLDSFQGRIRKAHSALRARHTVAGSLSVAIRTRLPDRPAAIESESPRKPADRKGAQTPTRRFARAGKGRTHDFSAGPGWPGRLTEQGPRSQLGHVSFSRAVTAAG